jgi:hypothetical protein
MAVGHDTSPYITVYKRDGDTFTKLPNPASLPTGNGQSVAFSSDATYMAVAHGTSPYVTVYKRDGDTFTKLPNPASLPTGIGYGVAFSSDTTYMAVGHDTSPYIAVYKRDGDTFTKLPNPTSLPASTGRGVAFSSDDTYMAVAHVSSPYITIYDTGVGPWHYILVSDSNNEIKTYNTSTSQWEVVPITKDSLTPEIYNQYGLTLDVLKSLGSAAFSQLTSPEFLYFKDADLHLVPVADLTTAPYKPLDLFTNPEFNVWIEQTQLTDQHKLVLTTEQYYPVQLLNDTIEVNAYISALDTVPSAEITAILFDSDSKTISTENDYYFNIDLSSVDFYKTDSIRIFVEDELGNTKEITAAPVTANLEIVTPEVGPSEFHSEPVTIIGTLTSEKGSVRYRVKQRNDGVETYLYPTDGSYTEFYPSPYNLNLNILADNFELGTTYLTVEAENTAGNAVVWEGYVTRNNEVPFIVANMNRLTVSGYIDDVDGDFVQFRIVVNGVQRYPESGYTDYELVPVSFSHRLRSSEVNIGEMNTVAIDYNDMLGGSREWLHDFTAEYQNIMFIDDTGEYYSDDEGTILKVFDFGVLIAGQVSQAKKLTIKNLTGYAITNLRVWLEKDNLAPSTNVTMSKTVMPYTDDDIITFSGTIEDLGTREFYVKLYTNKEATTGGNLRIKVSGRRVTVE